MGVPKFFRYISERYPCLSEVVKEYQLPEFDNLYLDMNGIIHVCSHPNDNDPHFRITEEKIFRDIFHYIETLFRMIQPQKLFFMAVDGVAPRAKMNQQRGRRFRSAKDAEMAEERAKLRGEELPSVDRFDSNCITPGTEFMTRLQAQLKYFVTFKVSTDKLWQKVKVILSGHETPGEGEHKIMDYIRYMKAQPGYASDTRHCLYGLDADLIMLGLCTHEPHFSLLREEVKYGKQNNQKRIPTPEETTFFLLHLSLMREYLELEFQQLKNTLPFPFDLEYIIDDWVLMGFLVGNDFIPHLPDLHINKGAFPILYKTYIDVLPTLKGYINQGGTLQLDRFQKYMEKLAAFDLEQFKEVSADLKYFEGKTGRRPGGKERHSYKPEEEPISPLKNKDLAALIASTEEILEGSEDDDENYIDVDSDEEDEDGTSFAEFCAHKKNYYIEKLEYEKVTPEVLRSQGEGYVRAIQWNLNYYYNGCCSWSWFFPHHYAPYISDIKNFSGLKLEYDLGQPFLPFQQLLAVLPAASKKLLPHAYHDLMENETSPIIDFYPTQFKTDLNGKRQDWEAVVLIPFIDQESLLDAMDTKESQLTEEERSRNKHGPMQIYSYTPDNLGSYIAPAYFPALANHHAKEENLNREQLSVEQSKLVRGLCPGVKLDVYFPGFPTLKHIPFSAELQKAKTKVFESASQGDNMILTILPQGHPDVNEVATQLMGKSIFVNWPHLLEARVIAVSNEEVRFSLHPENNSVIEEKMSKAMQAQWDLSKSGIEDRYFSRMGIEVGKTEILVYACTLEDKKFVMADDKMHYEKQWSKFPIAYALQTTRTNIAVYEPTSDLTLTVDQIFPPNSTVFGMDQVHYGFKGTVLDGSKNQRVKVSFLVEPEPDLEQIKDKLKRMAPTYLSGSTIAHRLNISSHILSRITGTIFVMSGEIQETERRPFKLNIGLNLKFNKRNEEVCGYTRRNKGSDFWMYSVKAGEEIRDYLEAFPEVFDFLKRESGSMDVHSTDIYPENTEEKLAKLGGWLKERSSAKAERQTCGAEVLEENMVLALEEHIDDFLKNQVPVQPSIVNIKPANLYVPKPKLGQSPDVKAEHHLFDRIINVRESNTVPLGAKGTIIGIHDAEKGPEAIFDIVFDKEFTGGLKLRSSPHRGYRLPGQAFINLSYGQARNSNRAPSKPTAIVEPSGTEEEGNNWNKHGHNSAFASWRNKPTQNSDLALQYEGEHRGRRVGTDSHYSRGGMDHGGRTRHYIPPNPCHHSAPQQLSTEYLAMFKQLQKAGQNNKGYVNTKGPNQSVEDSSSALKKMLKIADNTSKKPISPANTTIPTWNVSKNHSYCMQLLSMHQRMGCKLPQYHYADTRDGAIICTVTCFNGQEFRGDLAYANDPAAESAARRALEDHKGFGSNASAPFHPSSRPPPLMNSPQVPGVASSNRIPNTNWREPAKPSTLPQPPTNWYKTPRGASNFYPDWGAGSLPQYHPNLYNSQGQSNQLPLWQQPHRPPFIPLQAETRGRQHPQPRGRPREPTRSATSVDTTEGVSVRMPPSSAINTGRNPMKPTRTRIAANFNKGFSSSSPSGNSQ